jgi:hypothetical protein
VVRRELMHTCIAIASPHGIRRVSTHRQVRMRCTSGTDNFFQKPRCGVLVGPTWVQWVGKQLLGKTNKDFGRNAL